MKLSRSWLLYCAAWAPAVLVYGAATASRPEVTWWQGLLSGAVVMTSAALAGVPVWYLSGRLPYGGRLTARFIAIHVGAALLYAGVWVGTLFGWLLLVAPADARPAMRDAAVWQFTNGLYVYLLIAGISYLLRTQQRLRERETAAARAETAAARAQLQAIRAQLNPHFLFNSLHAVGALLRTNAAAAEAALEQLGDLLRRSLDHGSAELVPLAQEWDFARRYLELEQLRLGPRLELHASLERDALDSMVPPYLIQPLVENAVQHAAAASNRTARLSVHAVHRNGKVTITVADDGPGADSADSRRTGGFGLDSVRQQLAHRYGTAAAMNVTTAPGQGFVVELILPA